MNDQVSGLGRLYRDPAVPYILLELCETFERVVIVTLHHGVVQGDVRDAIISAIFRVPLKALVVSPCRMGYWHQSTSLVWTAVLPNRLMRISYIMTAPRRAAKALM